MKNEMFSVKGNEPWKTKVNSFWLKEENDEKYYILAFTHGKSKNDIEEWILDYILNHTTEEWNKLQIITDIPMTIKLNDSEKLFKYSEKFDTLFTFNYDEVSR